MVKIQRHNYTQNQKNKFSKKRKQNIQNYKDKHCDKQDIQLKNINNNSKQELLKNIPIIIRNTKNVYMPILGFFSTNIIIKLKEFDRCLFVFQNNIIIGCIFFHNLTYNFKKNMLGEHINDKGIKSKSDIHIYMMSWLFWFGNITPIIFNSSISFLKKLNKLENKNIIISTFTFLQLQQSNILNKSSQSSQVSLINQSFDNVIYKYKSIIEYPNSDEYKLLKKLGFTYCGYYNNINNDIINKFTIRYIKSCNSKDFHPIYIITRQIASNPIHFVRTDNLQNYLKKSNLFNIENVNRYALDNLFTFYVSSAHNDLCTKNKTVPYEYNFVMNYINNTLGNSHIISNYLFLYFAVREYLGKHSNVLKKQFAEVISSYDRIIEVFNEKSSIGIMSFFINNNYYYINGGFNNLEKLNQFINTKQEYCEYGFYIRNFEFIKDIYPVKSKTNYYLSPILMFVLNKNILNVYMSHTCGLLIFKETDVELYSNKEFDTKHLLYPPITFNYFAHEYFDDSIDVNDIILKMRKLCSIIGKVYKKYATLNINQMNGFVIVHPMIRLIKDPQTKDIYPLLYSINSEFVLGSKDESNSAQSRWIYELAISHLLDEKDQIVFDNSTLTDNEKLSYQPLEI